MESAVYEGWVRHRRRAPVVHEFRYGLYLLYLDLGELPRVFARRALWSARRPNLAWFRRADYLGPKDLALDEAVRRRVQAVTGRRPEGPVRVLTQVRTFGYLFNPLSVYYVFAPDGRTLETIVTEITNTPWGERHACVLPASRGEIDRGVHRHRFAKAFHVSPFMPMEVDYDWRFSEPGERLLVQMENVRDGTPFFDATLSVARRPLDGPTLRRCLVEHPLMTWRVTWGIYAQALRLHRKGAPFHPHPRRRPAGAGTTA